MNKCQKFAISDTDKGKFDERVAYHLTKGHEKVGKTHQEVDIFNGRIRYIAVFRRQVYAK